MAEDNNNIKTNNDNDEQEKRFLRMFSKQLATALKAKDEEEAAERERLKAGSTSKSTAALANKDDTKEWTRLRTAYIELCHDDPIVTGGNGDCRRLAKAIIPKQKRSKSKSRLLSPKAAAAKTNTNKLALSSRLVEGILQATSRAEARAVSSSSATTTQSAINDDKSTANTTLQEETESMFSPTITTSEGYAELAFAIFIEGPYRCLQKADNLQTTSNFLGSFQPPTKSNTSCTQNNNEGLSAEEKARLVDEATANLVSGMEKMSAVDSKDATEKQQSNTKANDDASSSSSEFFHNSKMPTTQLDNDNDSMQEIFAEESDPDDYDFGPSCTSDVQTIFGQQKDNDDELTFNPLELSEPSAINQTWKGARKGVYHLLSSASYGKLALGSISSRTWSEGDISEVLADLAFMLLLENKVQVGTTVAASESLLTQSASSNEEEDIVALWDRPLFLLRDRALDKNHGHDALPSYLQLLNALLSNSDEDQTVMSILSSPLKSQTEDDSSTLPPATTVGLSSLASLCSSKEMTDASSGKMSGMSVWSVCPRDEVRKTIMSSLYSLASIVESVRPQKSVLSKMNQDDRSENSSTWIRTAVCIISIIEYLTSLQARFDYQPLFEGGGSSRSTTLSESDAKEISDSGLFRELLSLFTTTRPKDETSSDGDDQNAENVVRMQLLCTLFTLSTQSPELLGRYAVRVPEFINEVHSTAFMEKNLIDGILWTSIGSSLLENKSDATASSKPKLKLRANSKLNTKLSSIETTSLSERSLLGFETLCTTSIKALEEMKQLVQRTESLNDEQQKDYNAWKGALGNIKRFSNCLSNCPSATNIWLDALKNKEGATSKAREHVATLKSTLASLPSFSDDELNKSHPGHKKDDDDNCAETSEDNAEESEKRSQSLIQIRKEYGAVVASVRSSVKVVSLALESKESSGLTVKGPSSFDASSKTD